MLNDFLSSVRGPGLVGLLLATVVLAFLSVITVSAFTDSDDGLAKEVVAQRLRISDIETLIEQSDKDLTRYGEFEEGRKKLGGLNQELKSIEQECGELRRAVEKLEEEIAGLGAQFVEYRQRYRAHEREGAVGEVVDLSKTHGESYKEVEITRVNASAIGVMTKSGPKRIPFEELSRALQDRFQFSEEEAEEFLSKQKERELARTSEARAFRRRQEAQKGEFEASQKEREREKGLARAEELEAKAVRAREQARHFRQRAASARSEHSMAVARGNSSSHLAKATEFERKASAADRYSDKCVAEARALKRKWR